MRAACRATIVVLLVTLCAVALVVPAAPAFADPVVVKNGDGTSTAYWNLTTPADYVLAGTQLSGGTASLAQTTSWWNSTTAADFANPSASTNIDLARWPGTVDLQTTAGVPQTLTLQPNAAAGQDSYIDGSPGSRSTNFGTATTMLLDNSGGTIQRPVIQFSLAGLPANAAIDSATLSLYMNAGVGNSFVSEVHYLTTAWNEGTVTWNSPWTNAGGDFPGYVAAQASLTNTAGWNSWNVTQLVDLWYRGRLANDGVILTMPSQGVSSQKSFRTSDYFNAALRPQLTIVYRVLGATGTYTSKVGGPGSVGIWDTISWNTTTLSLASDAFSGNALNTSKWFWINPPPAYNVGGTVPGSLWMASNTNVDVWGPAFTGNALAQPIVGNFTAIAKSTATLSHNFQKTGLLVYMNARNWFSAGETYLSATSSVNWAVTSTQDAVSTSDANVTGAPSTSWVEIIRSGNSFTAYTSPDGVTWTSRYTFTPAVEYPVEVRIAFFAADGGSGFQVTPSLDDVRVIFPYVPTVAVTTRTGNVNPPDASWTGWSAPYPTPSGSAMTGISSYLEFRLSLSVGTPTEWLSPQLTPAVGDLNLSWTNYVTSGTLTTHDLTPGDVAAWGTFNAAATLNGESIAYAYSLDSGGAWTAVTPGTSLAGASVTSGMIRFRAALSTSNATVTPTVTQMSLTYTHRLDHFYLTASASAAAGSAFTVTVTAKDASNATIVSWTGTVGLAARLADGVTPGGGTLGTTGVAIASGGTASLTTETYTKAETIRILAVNGTAQGLTPDIVVGPGAVSSITVTPANVTLLILDAQSFTAQGYDAYGNPVPVASYAWSVTGGVGSLNASAGLTVTFTSSALGNGTVEASSGGVVGTADVHVVAGTRPWLDFLAPIQGAWLTGVTTLRYTNSTGAVSVQFSYDGGTGWSPIGAASTPTGTFAWDTRGLNFTGGSLRAVITNNRTITNTTTVSPIGVDNRPPVITLGAVSDYQATNGTLLLRYATSPDTSRVDFSYFDGAWHTIGSTTSITGAYLWTPGTRINGVTVKAVATDRVGLTGLDEEMGVGRVAVGTNGPSIAALPTIHVAAGATYVLNLTFYVSDPDTPLAGLTIWSADASNVTAATGPYPSLTITYATAGTYPVTLWVSDGTNTAWTILTIVAGANGPPTLLRALPTVTFLENTVDYNGLRVTVGSFFSDPDGDPLNFSVTGAASVVARLNANGTMDLWAPTYWHGQESLRLRATDPVGGFAEGAFLVIVLWVNQPPVLDPLPALRLNASQSYTLDLAGYLHDVDTPLASLSVTVDSPYVGVQGRVLILNFPANWTGTGFNVTISDGSNVATQHVVVTLFVPPPPPAWWQAPYVLAIPPIGLLVVVAMFVQRQRWRPTKAFLVDERGQLLREFTLDPSCNVTYEQAVQAGALEAVDRDVRVSKYHARAVRGDMLSLIMIAIGPANVPEVEFARGILVNVQDRFEDGVKQRVEDVRAQEAELETAAHQMDEERADLQTRSRMFGDMANAVTLARSRLETESRAVRAQSLDVANREATVQQDRQAADARAREADARVADLDRRTKDLEGQEAAAAAMTKALAQREDALAPKEEDLSNRETGLVSREAEVKEREETVAAAESKLTQDIVTFHEKAQALKAQEDELGQERTSLDELAIQLGQQESTLKTKASEVESREARAEALAGTLMAREADLTSREDVAAKLETDLTSKESTLMEKAEALATQESALTAQTQALRSAKANLTTRTEELERQRTALDELARKTEADRSALEAKAAEVQEQEATVVARTKDLEDLRDNLGPRETALLESEREVDAKAKALADEEAAFQSRQDLVAAKALEIQQQLMAIQEREEALEQGHRLLDEARGALDARRKELEGKVAAFEKDVERHAADLEAQERTLGEAQLRLTKDREDFETARTERDHFIASKDIELEAREQSLADRAVELRAQGEEHAKRLADLAAREEVLEIDSSKLDKARADLETRKAEIAAMARDHDAKVARFHDEEVRKGEELRTWQTTLESEQALLKEQRETFEQEMQDLRESWAGRMLRVEQREEDLREREAKVQADVEWVARNEADLGKREKTAAENLKVGGELKAEAERVRKDLEQRALEVESRERSLREEAATQSIELQKRTETIQAMEADFAGKKAQSERELATLGQRLKDREAELQAAKATLDARDADLASREASLVAQQETLGKNEERLARELNDVQLLEKQLGAKQLELAQDRERSDAESLRQRSEADAVRQSLAAKEADLNSERERLERESAALQEKLGAKAKEMAAREKSVAAREDEVRAEEQDLEARIRELDSRERQAAARMTENAAQQEGLARGEQELKARAARFDETVAKFEAEAAAKRKEWESLQTTLKTQEAQIAASAESRQAELTKGMEEQEQRERSLNAMTTQLQIERSRLEAQGKNQAARQTELEAASARADARLAELKKLEDELLQARQTFESEKAGWSARRSEELKQLEATRDAAAEQTQQSEHLIAEAQRRAYMAAEAEKAAKRQAEELATAQAALERRRLDAEKVEKDVEGQMAQLREASQKLASKEVDLNSRAKELGSWQAHLASTEQQGLATAEELRARKSTLDAEAERLAALAAQMDKRKAEDEARHAAVDGKLADVAKREQILTTELQRADNLMEDLNHKEVELAAREKGVKASGEELGQREESLGRRDAELAEGMNALERMRKEHEARIAQADEDRRVAGQAREEAEATAAEAQKMKTQAEAMQAEVSKNMRFLQKKALDVLDREEKIRSREAKADEQGRLLDGRAQILEQKEKALEAEREEATVKLEKAKQDNEKLRAKLEEAKKAVESTIDMDEWKRDIENRVKIIQRKALELLDREEKLRKKEDELKALAAQLGVQVPQ